MSIAMPPDITTTLLSRRAGEIAFSTRVRKCLVRLDIHTLRDLVQHTADDLLETRNFGLGSLNEVRRKLARHGLRLKGD